MKGGTGMKKKIIILALTLTFVLGMCSTSYATFCDHTYPTLPNQIIEHSELKSCHHFDTYEWRLIPDTNPPEYIPVRVSNSCYIYTRWTEYRHNCTKCGNLRISNSGTWESHSNPDCPDR